MLKKILLGIVAFLLVLVLLAGGFVFYRSRGPHRDYELDFVKVGTPEEVGDLEVGVAKVDITPDLSLYDTYNDVDGDNRYYPTKASMTRIERLAVRLGLVKEGPDTWNDDNGNGRFDPVWIAGFNSNRPAKGVHDPLWARAIAFRNNGVTVAMVTLDAIGVFHDKIIDIRKMIDPSLNIDHVIVSSLHNHEAPDLMGIWSGHVPVPGNYDHRYMNEVKMACKTAVEQAVRSMVPADMYLKTVEIDPEGFVHDTRKPVVIDTKVCNARFNRAGTDSTIATLVSWGNHPEALDGNNPLLTSDFCGYWRDGVEQGVTDPNGEEGIGGMCLYFQGMVGGLMTQLRSNVPHRNGVDFFKEASFEKAEALGENLALVTLRGLKEEDVVKSEDTRVGIAAKTIYVPMEGLFKYAIMLGIIHPGIYWKEGAITSKTEVDVVRIGDLEILTTPGELYPEIAEGGIEAKPGRDFDIPPLEVPPLRKEMRGKVNMVFGLANDEIGYIIPKSQWDVEPPFVYEKSQYGEENSGGPDVAPAIHRESLALLKRMHAALEN